MSNKLTSEILINLTGNLTAKARQYGANMSEFARRNERAMSVVRATTAAAGRAMDGLQNRYTGMVAGFATGMTVKGVADFDAQMRRMATDAQLTKEQMDELHGKIRDVSNQPDIRIDASSLASGASELLGKAGDYKFLSDNLRNMGIAMQAFGIDGETAAGMLAQFHEKGVTGTKEVSDILDRLNAQFAIGSISVKEIAKVAPKLFSTILNQGPEAIAQMGALEQIFAKNKGSAEETVTSIQAVYASLTDKKNIKFLKGVGIDVFQKGTKEMKLPYELLKEVLERAKFDPQKLQDVFDQTGMQGLTSLLKPENLAMLDKMIYGQIELGSTQKSAKLNAEGFNSALQSLNNEWQRFAESNLAAPIQELADTLNSVDHETAENWLNVGKSVVMVTGGIIAARKAFQLWKGALDILGVGKGKGIPKGVSDVFGSGVMPVYVVNM
ncbi:phage tail tape measure protein, partial [Citrobacter freundii]